MNNFDDNFFENEESNEIARQKELSYNIAIKDSNVLLQKIMNQDFRFKIVRCPTCKRFIIISGDDVTNLNVSFHCPFCERCAIEPLPLNDTNSEYVEHIQFLFSKAKEKFAIVYCESCLEWYIVLKRDLVKSPLKFCPFCEDVYRYKYNYPYISLITKNNDVSSDNNNNTQMIELTINEALRGKYCQINNKVFGNDCGVFINYDHTSRIINYIVPDYNFGEDKSNNATQNKGMLRYIKYDDLISIQEIMEFNNENKSNDE